MRAPIVGGNWKMHLSLGEARRLAADLRARLGSHRGAQVLVFPPYPYLAPALGKLEGSAVGVGAQDVYPLASGAFTSAVSAPMVRSMGCVATLVGHSERRSVFGDTDEVVAEKLRAALDAGLAPVLCVGEQLEERRGGRTREVLARQLEAAFAALAPASAASFVIAYEPVWAIGTGLTASPDQAQDAHVWIRERFGARYGAQAAKSLRVQYGGSVKPENAADLMAQPDVDGLLVGGASLDAAGFTSIVRTASRRLR